MAEQFFLIDLAQTTPGESVDLTDDEATALAVYKTETALRELRSDLTDVVMAALKDADVWTLRSYEEGKSVPDERVAYKVALRQALADIAASDDPASVSIPTAPGWPLT